MNSLRKFYHKLVFAAIMVMGTFAFGQAALNVSVLPSQLPAGAYIDFANSEFHYFIQVITIELDAAIANADLLVITLPDEITLADLDDVGDPESEIYWLIDGAGLPGAFDVTFGVVAQVITGTVTIGGAAAGDVVTILFPVETDGTPTAGLSYTIEQKTGGVVDATASVTVATVAQVANYMSFDDILLPDQGDGVLYPNRRGKFHPNAALPASMFAAAPVNLINEGTVVANTNFGLAGNDWFAGSAGFGDVETVPDGNPDNDTQNAGGVAALTYTLWASQDRNMGRIEALGGAILVKDYDTGDDIIINEVTAVSTRMDLRPFAEGYWFFYLTSDATTDWALAASDSVLIVHAPTLVTTDDDIVATGPGTAVNTDGAGEGAGVDYDVSGTFENTDVSVDDRTAFTLDGGQVIGKDGTLSTASLKVMDIFWHVEDTDDNARIHAFIDDSNDLDTSNIVITDGVVSGLTAQVAGTDSAGIEFTTTAQFEDDLINFATLDISSPLAPAGDYFIYIVMYDGKNKNIELVRNINDVGAEAAMTLTVRHFPNLVFHDIESERVFSTVTEQFYPISWGLTKEGDNDPDAAGTAVIKLYAILEPAGEEGTVIGGGSIIAPDIPIDAASASVTLLSEITDDGDTREDNSFMWDIRAAGLIEGDYNIWGTITHNGETLTRQYGPVADNKTITLEHGNKFLANNPFEGETPELSDDDFYRFTWESATNSNSSSGLIKILLLPDGAVDPDGLDYSTLINSYSAPRFTGAANTNNADMILSGAWNGTTTHTVRIEIDGAATFKWLLDGQQMNSVVVIIAGVVAINYEDATVTGLSANFVANTGHVVGDFWEFEIYPAAANQDDYYWINPGSDGSTAGSVVSGYSVTTGVAELEVAALLDDVGATGPTPGDFAGGDFTPYFFYSSGSDFTEGPGAAAKTAGAGTITMSAQGFYTGGEAALFDILFALNDDKFDVYKDGTLLTIAGPYDLSAVGVLADEYVTVPELEGVSISFNDITAGNFQIGDNFQFTAYPKKPAVKADGKLNFSGTSTTDLSYRLTPNNITAQTGDTLTFTLQAQVTGGATVALTEVYIDIPSDKFDMVGTADSVFTTISDATFEGTVFGKGFAPGAGVHELEYNEYMTNGFAFVGGTWYDLATFRTVVTGDYTGAGLDHNLITFVSSGDRNTLMKDDNLGIIAIVVKETAADIQLYRLGSIAGAVEIEARTEENESVDVLLVPVGSYTGITNVAYGNANGGFNADGSVSAILDAGGIFTLTDIPTGDYEVIIQKTAFLSQISSAIVVQPTSVTDVTFRNADKLLGGDVAGYLHTDGKSYPDNQVTTAEDETQVVAFLGKFPASAPESYTDIDGDGEVTIADLAVVVKNAGENGDLGTLIYKATPIEGSNENAIASLRLMDTFGDESTYQIVVRDMSSIRGFSAMMTINPDEWDINSFASGLANYGDVRNHQIANGFEASFYSASRLWDAIVDDEMVLATITLTSTVPNAATPILSEVTLVDDSFGAAKAIIDASTGIPEEFALEQNFPNPFNPATTINFSLPMNGNVKLVVYNLLGQEVKTLMSGAMDAGFYKAVWNSRDNLGRKVGSGMYFYRLVVDNNVVATHKMVLLK